MQRDIPNLNISQALLRAGSPVTELKVQVMENTQIKLKNATKEVLKFNVPNNAAGKEIHLILEVNDKNEIASMYDYRRTIINVD